jgi:16S rRNA (uracil1498-N3)-methyltransferase
MSHLFIEEGIPESSFVVGASIGITGEEAHHALAVRRIRDGEKILLSDGRGFIAEGRVALPRPKEMLCTLESVEFVPTSSPELCLVQSLAKGDRDQRAVEAATEAGVDVVYPYQAMRSVSRWHSDKITKGQERWQKVAREATKQSLRARIPQVEPLISLTELKALASENMVLVLDPGAKDLLSEISSIKLRESSRVLLVVGPEGGFDPVELQQLVDTGAKLVRLGDTVLRTSTAGVAALAVLNVLLKRW